MSLVKLTPGRETKSCLNGQFYGKTHNQWSRMIHMVHAVYSHKLTKFSYMANKNEYILYTQYKMEID